MLYFGEFGHMQMSSKQTFEQNDEKAVDLQKLWKNLNKSFTPSIFIP